MSPMRDEVVTLTARALAHGRKVYVLVNNKAEGSSPLTIEALAVAAGRRAGGRAMSASADVRAASHDAAASTNTSPHS